MFLTIPSRSFKHLRWALIATAVVGATLACGSKEKSGGNDTTSTQTGDTSATASGQATQNQQNTQNSTPANVPTQAPAAPPAPGAPESAAASGPVMPPLSQDLTFKGTVNGRMVWAHRGDQFVCGRQGSNGFAAQPLQGYIAQGVFGHPSTDSLLYNLSINMASGYVGVGAYHNQGLKLFGTPTHAVPLTITLWPADSGAKGTHYVNPPGAMASVTVDLDFKSGTITADLASKSGGKVHFGGTWRCPPAPAPTT